VVQSSEFDSKTTFIRKQPNIKILYGIESHLSFFGEVHVHYNCDA